MKNTHPFVFFGEIHNLILSYQHFFASNSKETYGHGAMPLKQPTSVKLIGRSHNMLGINMKVYAQLMSTVFVE